MKYLRVCVVVVAVVWTIGCFVAVTDQSITDHNAKLNMLMFTTGLWVAIVFGRDHLWKSK